VGDVMLEQPDQRTIASRSVNSTDRFLVSLKLTKKA
jgi:hypothetical protein